MYNWSPVHELFITWLLWIRVQLLEGPRLHFNYENALVKFLHLLMRWCLEEGAFTYQGHTGVFCVLSVAKFEMWQGNRFWVKRGNFSGKKSTLKEQTQELQGIRTWADTTRGLKEGKLIGVSSSECMDPGQGKHWEQPGSPALLIYKHTLHHTPWKPFGFS